VGIFPIVDSGVVMVVADVIIGVMAIVAALAPWGESRDTKTHHLRH